MVLFIKYSNYVVGWGTLILINTAIAQLQGRSALLWFFVSLFLGPIATFVLIITYEKNIINSKR